MTAQMYNPASYVPSPEQARQVEPFECGGDGFIPFKWLTLDELKALYPLRNEGQ